MNSEQIRQVHLTVNGQHHEVAVPVRKLLLDVLREDLGLTGTHAGCEHGVCGCCNVLVEEQAVRSCLLFAVQLDGRQVTTVEGLARDGELHPLQRAFADHHALQCGYCTPGMLITAFELLESNPSPSEQEIREALAGNLCRCTGYVQIVEAVSAAAHDLTAECSTAGA
jgi:aerobic carbon-monoxide dehydrogenase small subunit